MSDSGEDEKPRRQYLCTELVKSKSTTLLTSHIPPPKKKDMGTRYAY